MRKITYTFTSLIWIFLIFLSFVSAQESQSADWFRVQSDDGEFSVEVPVNYDFYLDNDGFLVSDNSKSYRLSKMKMLNAYHEKTLLSFEVYETNRSKTVAEILADLLSELLQLNPRLSEDTVRKRKIIIPMTFDFGWGV